MSRSHFDFVKFRSTNKLSTSPKKLYFVKCLLGKSSLTKIIPSSPLQFLSYLYGKEKLFMWNWEFGNVLSSLVSYITKLSTCFKTNSFSWLNLNEIEFIFICPIIALLTFFNLKFCSSNRGFRSCLFSRLESLFSELFSGLPLSISLFWSLKYLSFQDTSFKNSF